jgi:hypothetical protein
LRAFRADGTPGTKALSLTWLISCCDAAGIQYRFCSAPDWEAGEIPAAETGPEIVQLMLHWACRAPGWVEVRREVRGVADDRP